MWVAEILLTREKKKRALAAIGHLFFCVNLPILTGENISKGRQRISVPLSISPRLSRGQRSPAAGAHPMAKEYYITSLTDAC